VHEYLLRENYVCEQAFSLHEAKEKLLFYAYDCIILDIMLPDGSGLDLLNFIKEKHIQGSTLIVSAKGAMDDKIRGLEEGADDYITKPFHLPELNARLRAIHRRKDLNGSHLVVFNEISLNTNTFEVAINNKHLDVTRKEVDLLLYFLVNRNRLLSRQAIATHLWGDYTDNLSNVDFV
jgi:DNA-binding response OmpR family regulator